MAVSITDSITYKRIVTAGNNKIYYEDIDVTAGTLTELTAASGDINTSDQLNMFEGFQKVFIVNGSNLKVADFINTKLTHTALTTSHAHGDIITQDQGSSNYAYMVVDYTNTAKTATYGYAYYGGSATAFNTSNSCSGSGSGTAFTPTAVTAKPHWYSWTVYPGSNQGTMPNKAYLGCLYRGRCVLSGDPEHPNQWYMTKVSNPWNWYFDSSDPLTAVRGGNADAGEVGDIIRALIPYKDDYLIFGCANSIWMLTGDPAPDGGGGIINHVDLTVGMFGANSWCFDGGGNLYFWGTSGFYKMPYGFKSVENLTQLVIPNIVNDEAADPSTHRITLAYDRKRNGVLVCITKLSDGTNSNYFYDIKIEGFYPETYPEECGAYSLLYYAANDTSYSDLLIGCKDGYVRYFKNTAKDDDIGGSDEAISSYFGVVQKLNEDDDMNGKLTSLTVELSGGASGGDFTDTDSISYDLYSGSDAETAVENMRDGDTPHTTGTLTGVGRKARIRTRLRAAWLAIKIYNSTLSQSWGINRIFGIIKKAGRIN